MAMRFPARSSDSISWLRVSGAGKLTGFAVDDQFNHNFYPEREFQYDAEFYPEGHKRPEGHATARASYSGIT